MFTAAFWAGAADRAIKSFAQALILMWGFDEGFNILSIDFVGSLGVGAGALVLSLLTSIVSAPVGDRGTPSLMRGSN